MEDRERYEHSRILANGHEMPAYIDKAECTAVTAEIRSRWSWWTENGRTAATDGTARSDNGHKVKDGECSDPPDIRQKATAVGSTERTIAAAIDFERAIAAAERNGPSPAVDPCVHQAMIEALRSELAELRAQIDDWLGRRRRCVRQLERCLGR